MSVIGDGVIAFLAAVGLTTLLWQLIGVTLRKGEKFSAAVMVLPLRGAADEWEGMLQQIFAAQHRAGYHIPVLLADCGLGGEEVQQAEQLQKRFDGAVLLLAEELPDYFTQK